jgi:hypothetical protein
VLTFKKHPPYQCLECIGCPELFHEANEFIRHIEFNKCSLSLCSLKGEIIQKAVVQEMLKSPDSFDPMLDDGDDQSEAGGVSLLEYDLGSSTINHPILVPFSSDGRRAAASLHAGMNNLSLSTAASNISPAWGKSSAIFLFPEAQNTPVSKRFVAVGNQTNLLRHQLWNPDSVLYKASSFYNGILECYVCPFTSCR